MFQVQIMFYYDKVKIKNQNVLFYFFNAEKRYNIMFCKLV